MRKGKNHYIFFAALAIAGAAITACSSDDINEVEANQKGLDASKTYYMSVDATKGSSEAASRTNRALSLEGQTLTPTWATNENVYVQGKLQSDNSYFWFKGSLQPQSAGTSTKLNGAIRLPDNWVITIDDAIGTPHQVSLQFPRPEGLDYSGQVGTLADIAAKYDYARAENVRIDIHENNIIGVNTVNFVNQQAIVKFSLVEKNNESNVLSPTNLIINYGSKNNSLTIPKATYTTNGNGVLYVAIPGDSEQNITLSATCSDGTYTYNKSSVTFQNGKYYDITVKMTKQP